MKHILTDEELQEISDRLRNLLEVKYKDEIGDIPEHIKDTLCQNYALQFKNNRMDLDALLNQYNIAME